MYFVDSLVALSEKLGINPDDIFFLSIFVTILCWEVMGWTFFLLARKPDAADVGFVSHSSALPQLNHSASLKDSFDFLRHFLCVAHLIEELPPRTAVSHVDPELVHFLFLPK